MWLGEENSKRVSSQGGQHVVRQEQDAKPAALDSGHISLTGAAKVPSPIAATEKMEAVPAAVIPSSLAQVFYLLLAVEHLLMHFQWSTCCKLKLL